VVLIDGMDDPIIGKHVSNPARSIMLQWHIVHVAVELDALN
jgi:hypothetical protein